MFNDGMDLPPALTRLHRASWPRVVWGVRATSPKGVGDACYCGVSRRGSGSFQTCLRAGRCRRALAHRRARAPDAQPVRAVVANRAVGLVVMDYVAPGFAVALGSSPNVPSPSSSPSAAPPPPSNPGRLPCRPRHCALGRAGGAVPFLLLATDPLGAGDADRPVAESGPVAEQPVAPYFARRAARSPAAATLP